MSKKMLFHLGSTINYKVVIHLSLILSIFVGRHFNKSVFQREGHFIKSKRITEDFVFHFLFSPHIVLFDRMVNAVGSYVINQFLLM